MSRRVFMVAGVAASALLFRICAPLAWPGIALAWIAMVPWLLGLDRARSLGEACVLGLAMSVAFSVAVLGWFGDAMAGYTGAPPVVGTVTLVLLASLLQPQFVALAVVRNYVRRRATFVHATLACALAHVGAEWAYPKLLADSLGHGMFAYPWILQAADLAGVGGLTFVLLIVNLCVAETVRRRAVERYMMRESLLPTACAALLVAAVASYGALRERQFAAPATSAGAGTDGTIRVALVQADISDYDRMRAEIGSYETVRRVLDAHYELSRRALRSTPALDLLVWPETVYPTSFGKPKSEQGADFDREIADFVAASGVPLIFGTYDSDGSGEYNAAAFLEPRPEARSDFQSYRKTMLFPLTERVPAVLESGVLRGALPWLGTWKPGSGPKVVPVTLPRTGRKLRIAPLICFDAIAPPLALEAVRKGAELIVTLSNDAWFSDGRGPWQHLVVSAFRSVETRRPQVRVTNTGISAVITPTGKIVELASVHEATVLVASVTPVAEATTLVLRWGDWFGPTALAAAALLALTAGAALRRSEHR